MIKIIFIDLQQDEKIPSLKEFAAQAHKELIKNGKIPDPAKVEKLAATPLSSETNSVNELVNNSTQKQSSTNSSNQNSEDTPQLTHQQSVEDYYQNLPGDYYDKYEGYINPNILRGRNFSTTELDKMLEEAKYQEMKFIASVSVISIILLIIIWRILRMYNMKIKNSSSSKKEKKPISNELKDNMLDNEISSDFDSIIEKMEKLRELKESRFISDVEFEIMKTKLFSK
jgi:hypothetical protein